MTPQDKVDQISADLDRARALVEKAHAERQAAAVGAYGGETILGDAGFKKATRAALDAEHEVESLTLALAGANADLARWQCDQEAQRKRDRLDRLVSLCRERESLAAEIEKAMQNLTNKLEANDRLVAEIKTIRPPLPGTSALFDPLDAMEFRLNLKAGFIGLDKMGFGDPVNPFGVHMDEPLAEMEARVHRQIIEKTNSILFPNSE